MGAIQEEFDPVVEVGKFTSIASQVIFFGNCEHPRVMNRKAVSNYPFQEYDWGDYTKCGCRGKIVIGSDVWIGERAIIMDGVTIGHGAIIAAGAVISKDVPPYAVVAGNPGQIVKFSFEIDQIKKLLKSKWWDLPDETIRTLVPIMKDVNLFLAKLEELKII